MKKNLKITFAITSYLFIAIVLVSCSKTSPEEKNTIVNDNVSNSEITDPKLESESVDVSEINSPINETVSDSLNTERAEILEIEKGEEKETINELTIASSTGIDENDNALVIFEEIVPMNDIIRIEGYQLSDGRNVPIIADLQVLNVLNGDNAYSILKKENPDLSSPTDGMEYIIISMNVTYVDGDADRLFLSENQGSLGAAAMYFSLSNGDSNAEAFSDLLDNCIYDLIIMKGESVEGTVTFLHKQDSNEPLGFIGFCNALKFSLVK